VNAALSPGSPLPPIRVAIEACLDRIVAEMSHWEPGSELSRFNRAPAGSWVALSPGLAHVVAAALDLAQASEGAFDPAIGALVDLWGFGPPGRRSPPSENEVVAARSRSGWRMVRFDRAARRLYQPGGVQLDLSGIGKGHVVDALSALLLQHGCSNHLVEIGGELLGRGTKPNGNPWWVDLDEAGGMPGLRIALHGCAVATSGDYVRGSHTIDPRNGEPCRNGMVAVSVIATSTMMADALASALFVLGPAEGLRWAGQRDIAARLLHRTADGLTEAISPALAAML
jgi:FAD:protein FMN transferase